MRIFKRKTKTDNARVLNELAGVNPEISIISGRLKFVRDAATILELRLFAMKQAIHWHLLGSLVFPMSTFFFARGLSNSDPESLRRIMVGALVFGLTLQAVNAVSMNMISDRFQGRLNLIVTMPVSKFSYATGMIAYTFVQALMTLVILLLVATLIDIDFKITWSLLTILAMLITAMSGMGIFMSSFAPSEEVGGVITSMFSIVMVMISPVFFSMDQAPIALRYVGYISPVRYAADALNKALSGNNDVVIEMIVLGVIGAIGLILGVWKMKWRDL